VKDLAEHDIERRAIRLGEGLIAEETNVTLIAK
jgi:hypothetical protein